MYNDEYGNDDYYQDNIDDNEYYDEGGDEDENEEGDYGDDDGEDNFNGFGEDYEYADEKGIVNFGYKDIGAEGRAGGVIDEDLDIQILETKYRKKLKPRDKFALDLVEGLNALKTSLKLSDLDVKTIKLKVDELQLIKWRSPLYFILGYTLRLDMDSPDTLRKKLSQIKKVQPGVDLFTVVKYGKYWKTLTL